MYPLGLTLDQAIMPSFQNTFIIAIASFLSLSVDAVTELTFATSRRSLLATLTASYKVSIKYVDDASLAALKSALSGPAAAAAVTTAIKSLGPSYATVVVSPAVVATVTVTPVSSPEASAAACFAGTEQVTLESGAVKALADVRVGDRVLSVNGKGEAVYSDVVYLPHGANIHPSTFAQIGTESGLDLKMTMNHILPAGACVLPSLPLVAAASIAVGDCVQTVSGREHVVSVGKVEARGIYTIIAIEELIVVNGIVATPFGGVNPTLANVYYNLHRLAYSGCSASFKSVNGWMRGAMELVWTVLAALSS